MKIYRIELSRISKIYELVAYNLIKVTDSNYLVEEPGFCTRKRIPKRDTTGRTFSDKKAGLLRLTQMLENLRIEKLEEAERAMKAYEQACSELRGERVLGYESIIRMDGCGRESAPYYMVAGDFRQYFPGVSANYEVEAIIKKNRLETADMEFDCESACFYAYWPATPEGFEQAKNFIDKFDAFLTERKAA